METQKPSFQLPSCPCTLALVQGCMGGCHKGGGGRAQGQDSAKAGGGTEAGGYKGGRAQG